MIAGSHVGAFVRFEAMIAAVIEAAARVHGLAPFAVCLVDVSHIDGRRFAVALHEASPTQLDPAHFAANTRHKAPQWCRAAPLAMLAPVAAAVLGAETDAAVEAAHTARAVPVVILADGLAMVAAFERPPGTS